MQEYVCGFVFDAERKNVLLIRKSKPDWQRGLLNGIGGKIEDGELPLEAIVREFEEETGLMFNHSAEGRPANLHPLIMLSEKHGFQGPWKVWFFYSIGAEITDAKTKTDEQVEVVPVEDVVSRRVKTMNNLIWLIPLALDDTVFKPLGVWE